jgi:RND family efflux transporter MFP subunit
LVLGLVAPSSTSAEPQGPPAAVRVDAVREELLVNRRPVTGDLRAARRVEVASREKGLVLELGVREGDVVEQGAVLAQLDSELLELELAAVEAQRVPDEAKVKERQSDLEQARRDLASVKTLLEREAANPKEVLDAQSKVAGVAARLEEAQGQLAVLAAQAATLAKRIRNTTIRAPFAGTVTRRRTELGAWLAEGAAVVELLSTGELEVWLDVPQDLFAVLKGYAGSIEVEVGGSGAKFALAGIVVVPDIDPRGRAFHVVGPVRTALPLAAGMSVTALVPTGKEQKLLTIHRDAILRNEVGSFVYSVLPGAGDQPASAAPTPIEILFQTGERAVVRAGRLQAGMQVVVEGNERLYPMAPIQPLPAAGTAPPAGAKGAQR